MRIAVDGPYHLAPTTVSVTIEVTGSSTIMTNRYRLVNGGAQEVYVVISKNSGVTAAFPAAGAKSATPGIVIPANDSVDVDGPPCGQGNSVWVAGIAVSGSSDIYITALTAK